MITSIGSECYLTLPKGQIPDTTAGASLVPGGGHVLIVPISHYPTLSAVPHDLALPIIMEIEKYVSSPQHSYMPLTMVQVQVRVEEVLCRPWLRPDLLRGVASYRQGRAYSRPSCEFSRYVERC